MEQGIDVGAPARRVGTKRRRAGLLALVPLLPALTVGWSGLPAAADPPTCVPKAPVVVGAGAAALTVEIQPCSIVPVASAYDVAAYLGSSSTPAVTQTLAVASPRTTFSGLTAGGVYRFGVTARNSTWTSPASARSLPATPGFTSLDAFTAQQYLDLTAAAATAGQLSSWRTSLSAGTLTPVAAIGSLLDAPYLNKQAGVTRLYWAYFRRIPDKGGLTYWTNRVRIGTATLGFVSTNFASSTEFQNTYGTLTNAQFVTQAYLNVFDRPVDPGGLSYWTHRLNTDLTRAEVMTHFTVSNEFQNDTAVLVAVVDVTLGLLRRVPTSGEVAAWPSGTTRDAIAVATLGTSAYGNRVAVVPPVVEATAYDALFTRNEKPVGITQGDGARSTRLPDDRIYWSMGDSTVGTISATWPGTDGTLRRLHPDGSLDGADPPGAEDFIHNAIVTTPASAPTGFTSHYGTAPVTGAPADFFSPTGLPTGHYFWPAAATVEGSGSSAAVRSFLMDVSSAANPGPGRRLLRSLNASTLAPVGSTLTVPAPTWTDPATSHSATILYGSGLLTDGGYTYVYGSWTDPACGWDLYCYGLTAKAFVARAPVGSLTTFSSWRYWSGGTTWATTAAGSVPVADFPVDSIVKSTQGYLTFLVAPAAGYTRPGDAPERCAGQNPDQVTNHQLMVFRAEKVTGPWNLHGPTPYVPGTGCPVDSVAGGQVPVAAYDIPDTTVDPTVNARDYAYLAQAHPDVRDPDDPNRILVGWSNNRGIGALDADNLRYRPRFIWLDIAAL